jgi:hypothetical protein
MAITLDIKVGDIVLGGKFKNKRIEVKSVGTDELGQPTINGKSILKFRIEKLLPKEKQSKETREGLKEMTVTKKRLQKLAGLLTEQEDYEDEWERSKQSIDPDMFDDDDELRDKMIKRYGQYFDKVGFDGHSIDFSFVDPEAIKVMGEALKKLLASDPSVSRSTNETEDEDDEDWPEDMDDNVKQLIMQGR